MKKMNCWEFTKCGREPFGKNAEELGVCPATILLETDGLNGGANGGRICWAVIGTLCGGEVQGTFAQKKKYCFDCDFYKKVKAEEGGAFQMLKDPKQI